MYIFPTGKKTAKMDKEHVKKAPFWPSPVILFFPFFMTDVIKIGLHNRM